MEENMDKSKIVFSKVKEMIVQELNVKPEMVSLNACLQDDFGADSLDALELFNELESEFLITIDDETAMNLKDVQSLVNFIVDSVSDDYFE
jgi:acyl carrier protein